MKSQIKLATAGAFRGTDIILLFLFILGLLSSDLLGSESADRWFGKARTTLARQVGEMCPLLLAITSPQLSKGAIFTPALSVFLSSTKATEKFYF